MDTDKLRRDLADMRALAQAEEEFTQTNVRSVDVSAEDIDAVREAYRLCAIAWRLFAAWEPDDFEEFGSPEMRRRLPLHRLYAIEERWQAGADARSSRRDFDRALMGPQGSERP